MHSDSEHRNTGTVLVAVILLFVVAAVISSIARYFWLDSANKHFDRLISAYIAEKQDLTADDHNELKARLLEDSIFIKMHRWQKDTFIEDKKLFKEMIITRDQAQMRREKENTSTMEIMINL
ncbi:MAG: hypothetical protein KAY65_13575 [Planctomycetes bacterium]|nr:hypothetical protein [Planctomycetota bacterium]